MNKINPSELMNIIKEVADEFNESQDFEKKITVKEDTKLYGSGGILSSIELVTFIIELEYKLEDEFGILGVLTSEKAMSQKNSPFRTIKTLVEYICSLEVE
ncbi:MAG: hypothetical protein N4A64_04845 [Marinisporobacter sp.]|jgi:acyl carrier protein|nr:hypothetical protein [Marinisporobacter sp.]